MSFGCRFVRTGSGPRRRRHGGATANPNARSGRAPAKVAAILDFDRMRVLYPELDVARALLSCALDVESGKMEPDLADRFLEGYRSAHPFPRGGLPRAFKLLWWLEATNWMVHDMDKYSAPPARFARENIWLTRNWNELEDRFGEL